MPRIRCNYKDCIFLEDRFCGAAAVEIDPEQGCLTYRPEDETDLENLEADIEDDLDWDDDEDLYEDDDTVTWEDDDEF